MLTELCHELKNWFAEDSDKHVGAFTISNGVLTPSVDLKENQYYRIVGSIFNDGVHQFGDLTDVLTDETFEGAIWCMRVPKSVVDLNTAIDTWKTKYDAYAKSPFVSESFGGYSYNRGSDNFAKTSWKDVFSNELARWRKL